MAMCFNHSFWIVALFGAKVRHLLARGPAQAQGTLFEIRTVMMLVFRGSGSRMEAFQTQGGCCQCHSKVGRHQLFDSCGPQRPQMYSVQGTEENGIRANQAEIGNKGCLLDNIFALGDQPEPALLDICLKMTELL